MEKREYSYDIRQYQLRSLVLLETIDRVCREHDITYYLTDGSLLGAVRHGGFIPWDDDMDIAMPRADYDKLMAHADEWVPQPFFIVTHDNTPQYPKYFAKLEDTSTTIVENFYLGYAGGIYMDIFPLDEVPDNKLLRTVHFYKFNLLRRLQYLQFRDPYKHGRGVRSWLPLLVRKVFSRSWVHRRMQETLREYQGQSRCHVLMSHDNKLRCNAKDVFGLPARMEFEGIEANVPSQPEQFLTDIYGDNYMMLPPEEERVSHFHAYCDLNTPYKTTNFEELRRKVGLEKPSTK